MCDRLHDGTGDCQSRTDIDLDDHIIDHLLDVRLRFDPVDPIDDRLYGFLESDIEAVDR